MGQCTNMNQDYTHKKRHTTKTEYKINEIKKGLFFVKAANININRYTF